MCVVVNIFLFKGEQKTPIRRPDTLPFPQDTISDRISSRPSRFSTTKLPQPESFRESDSDSDATPPSTIRKPVRAGNNCFHCLLN